MDSWDVHGSLDPFLVIGPKIGILKHKFCLWDLCVMRGAKFLHKSPKEGTFSIQVRYPGHV